MTRNEQESVRSRRGFSLIEVSIVTAIGMAVTMTALPNMVNAIANMRMRSSMTSLAGVLQDCRALAIKQNRTMTTHFQVRNYGTASGVMAYVKRATDTTSINGQDAQVQLEEPVVQVTTPSGTGAPAALDNATLGFIPQTADPSFNTTGLPCAYASGVCTTSGFVYYFHDSRPGSHMGWAALSVSPAGRMKKWFWSGSAWTD